MHVRIMGKMVFVTLIDMHYLSEMLRAGLGFLIGLKGKFRLIWDAMFYRRSSSEEN